MRLIISNLLLYWVHTDPRQAYADSRGGRAEPLGNGAKAEPESWECIGIKYQKSRMHGAGERRRFISIIGYMFVSSHGSCYQQVNYCENNADCRRFLQLIHFGEKFDPANCRRTCDNCSKMVSWIEKDVTPTAKQLVMIMSIPFPSLVFSAECARSFVDPLD